MQDLSLLGLTSVEARSRLKSEGYNEPPARRQNALLKGALTLVSEPTILVLFCCAGAYFVLGDAHEAWVLMASVVLVSGITLYQGYKTEKTLETLKDLSAPRALVIRDGIERRIPGREVVRGDLMVLREGDRVAADAVVLEVYGLQADESLLTGESVPVEKAVHDEVLSGTVLTRGRGLAEVLRTGAETRLGKIGKSLYELESSPTRLQRDMAELTKRLAIAAVVFCLLITFLYGLQKGDWLNGILAGLTLGVALMPEEIPVVLTIFFAMGAWRISRKKVLTRKLSAIEALGTVQILATDKTGTLTLNRMTVKKLWYANSGAEKEAVFDAPLTNVTDLTHSAWLACPPRSFDPMDLAVGKLHKIAKSLFEEQFHLQREFPLMPQLLVTTQVWQTPSGLAAYAKGAPEHVLALCSPSPLEHALFEKKVSQWAQMGLRILAVARAEIPAGAPPPTDVRELKFRLLGLLGFADPPRENVPSAIAECHAAGIRVVMITGDHPSTAFSIAREIGLAAAPKVLTGSQLLQISEADLLSQIQGIDVFARISPEQKLRIVQAYQSQRKIVAMTGDGVNDGPSLKAAHIGIAMGGRGTDLAREASTLVVLDDNFATIVEAIRLGRTIFSNIKRAISYVVAAHIPIAGTALLQLLFPGPMILLPIHVVFLELIIDPACSLAFEAVAPEADVMHRPPRDPSVPLISGREYAINVLLGCVLFLGVGVVHYAGWRLQLGEHKIRTLCFATLVLGNLSLILADIAPTPSLRDTLRPQNPIARYLLVAALSFLSLTIYVPAINTLFKFTPLAAHEMAAVLLLTFGGLILMIYLKALPQRRAQKNKRPNPEYDGDHS